MTRIALASLLLIAVPAAACEPALKGDQVHRTEGKDYVVAWRSTPAALRVSEFFVLDVATCANSPNAVAEQLHVDAVMPEHKHGMNYRPTVTKVGDGRFRAEGLLLHMPGVWEFRFDLRGSAGDEVIRERVSLR